VKPAQRQDLWRALTDIASQHLTRWVWVACHEHDGALKRRDAVTVMGEFSVWRLCGSVTGDVRRTLARGALLGGAPHEELQLVAPASRRIGVPCWHEAELGEHGIHGNVIGARCSEHTRSTGSRQCCLR